MGLGGRRTASRCGRDGRSPEATNEPALDTDDLHFSSVAFGRRIKAKATWEAAAAAFPAKFDEGVYNEIVDDMLGVLAIYGLAEASRH